MTNENNHHDETSSFEALVDAPMTEPPLVASTLMDSREDAEHLSQPPNQRCESPEPSIDSSARNDPSSEPTAEALNRDDAPLARAAEAAMSAPGSNDSPPNEATSPPTPSNNAPGTRLHKEEETESQQQPKRPKTDEQPPHEAAKPQQEEQGEEMEVEELNQGSNQAQESQQEEQAEEMEAEELNQGSNQEQESQQEEQAEEMEPLHP
ncbi:hypothetical protein Ae201684P_015558 [Aphanomyces euteiches]|nr:hypothetical protein Ae201684P_015558 [Aphanomyces euteiches]